ncbi:MAG: hypothetical protein AAFN50_15585 [Pseudomonadota bacterium]
MFAELPQNLILFSAATFLLGWILSAISSRLGDRFRARRRDPRDDRIRELEAEVRIAQAELETKKETAEEMEEKLKETTVGLERRDYVISEQQAKIEKVSKDLKESVLKTRELRNELADRATETVHAEAKIREVETELEIVQASSDMIATGVLDYSLTQEALKSDDDEESSNDDPAEVSTAAT